MTKLLEEGIKAVRALPEERQNAAGELLLHLAERQHAPHYRPTPEQIAAIQEGIAEADRGEFVSDEEMAAFWRKCGL